MLHVASAPQAIKNDNRAMRRRHDVELYGLAHRDDFEQCIKGCQLLALQADANDIMETVRAQGGRW